MRKVIGGFLAIIVLLAGMFWVTKIYFFSIGYTQPLVRNDQGISYIAKTEGKDFYVLDAQGAWQKTFLAGVDIGLGVPGSFPGEFAIGYDMYFDWLTQIGGMGANVIRVYTPQSPAFYHALYEYNRVAATPLYLMQGVYMDESDVLKYGDVFAPGSVTIQDMRQDIVDCVNMLHGNAVIGAKPGKASGVYQYDVSSYVIGWILGIECEAYLVDGTNQAHPEITDYKGEYVYTEGASPFETFIAHMMDLAVTYETQHYRMQRPVAFTNWVTTDPLTHPNEPFPDEDSAVIDVEHIKGVAAFTPGFFASYHVYPYYPDFLNYPSGDPAVDEDSYFAYLKSLSEYHSMPVLVSEFGLPTSRGVTHINHLSGLNQGGNSEQRQGAGLVKMLDDIYRSGCMGGIVFAWQDEWFKTSWNTMDFDDSNARNKWFNVESSEENFGVISFSAFPSIHIDGEGGDWFGAETVGDMNVDWDEAYLYLRVNKDDIFGQTYYVPIDTIGDEGSDTYQGMTFQRAADFVLVIDGAINTRLLIDPYYDPNYKLYGSVLFSAEELAGHAVNGSGNFNIVRQNISSKVLLPATGQVVPVQFWETGKMRYGNSNPDSPDYDSLSDFCVGAGFVEIRIPWMLLNFADPSSRKILANLHTGQPFGFETIRELYLGVGEAGDREPVAMNAYTLPSWGAFQFTQRTKLSYGVLRDTFPQYATYPINNGALDTALQLRDTRLLYVRLDYRLRNTDLITFFLIVLLMLVAYLYILLLAVNFRLNLIHKRQERERVYLRSLLGLPEEKLHKKLHLRYLCSSKGADLLCRFLIEEKLTDTDVPLLAVLRTGKFQNWMQGALTSRDVMLCILVIRLSGLLRISRFQQQIMTLMKEHGDNLNLQYTGFLALTMMGNLDSIVCLCAQPEFTKLLSYRSLKEIFASYTGGDKHLLYELLLDSPDLYIRRIIVKNVGEEGFAELSPYLVRMLSSSDVSLLCDVVRSLGQLHCAAAGDRIAALMQSDNWTLRNVVVVALANIDVWAYLPQMLNGLRDKEWWVRYNSAHELCAHIPLDALAEVIPMLNDRFAKEILQFAIQETRMMGKEVSLA